ncbi:MAG: large conductance mechanosensitive channel protein MscL [Saprospiraceae bacterium]|jgi:large conductance mechanosensitive channel|nr:large conductance mechanosensitive channel protein MscL [Saprospiraceae bacterium]|tara:strand:- start:9238 stop:9618 length:381 start_codon:yes stop_codon:yes gene_type:complete
MWKEFKAFIMTGNVIDFAVAVILAGAVGLVVNGFVNDIMMPIVGSFTGGIDFSDLQFVLATDEAGEVTNAIKWGSWITSIINLIIVGGVLFWMVKVKTKIDPPAKAAPSGPTQEDLLAEIRDLLKK